MSQKAIKAALTTRFGDVPEIPKEIADNPTLAGMAARGSCRHFAAKRVEPAMLDTLCAIALSAPSKSDLQQRDIIQIRDQELKAELSRLLTAQNWIADIPHLLVFCGNNRRQRQIHDWRRHDFANDHLDAFFNATADAAIALASFITAAEATGLGCCPISTIRNHADKVSTLLNLPDHVFPLAGLAVGYPAFPSPRVSKRLPLRATVHIDQFDDSRIREDIETYDRDRHATAPYASQRSVDLFGQADPYTWSEEKTRQYALPERADFGDFIRRKGFNLN